MRLHTRMKTLSLGLYRWLFARPALGSFHRTVFKLSLKGLGVLNYENESISGELAFLRRLIRGAGHPLMVLDVGANVGKYANTVKNLSPDATVYAFEPHPLFFPQLRSAGERYGYATLNVACSDVEGSCRLYDYADRASEHASLCSAVFDAIHRQTTRFWDVEATTLDRFIEGHRIPAVDLVKIDAEGSELKILQGARAALRRGVIAAVQFEFNIMHVGSRVFLKDFLDVLDGYRFYRLLPRGLAPMGNYDPVYWELFAYQNVLAIRDDRVRILG